MKHTLIALKISALDVLPLLGAIKEATGDRKRMEILVLKYYKKTSKRITSPHHNPLRTRVVHSLRKLKLLQDQGDNIKLSAEGLHLYNISDKPEKYKKEFAQMILRLDREKCHIIDLIQEMNGKAKYNKLLFELGKKDPKGKNIDEKLRRWLQFLTYCEILHYQSPVYKLNMAALNGLESKSQSISLVEFEKILYEEYDKIKKTQGVYVPIPRIKSVVAGRLAYKGFWPGDFECYMLKLIQKHPTKKIILAETGVRKTGGIFHNKIYYHFVVIS